FFPRVANHTAIGVDYAKNKLLRVGIVLYGFRITFQQIEGIGWAGIIIDILMISCTFILAYYIGTKLLRLDKQTTMLIGAGSSIC
ncbi:YeiH family protein, partial [Escherichia coli]|nr:YeiH family protein [Escherichia coli]